MAIPIRTLQRVLNSGRDTRWTVWDSKAPSLKGTEASLSCVQCFLYLVSSSVNVSTFHSAWLDTFWTCLSYKQDGNNPRSSGQSLWISNTWKTCNWSINMWKNDSPPWLLQFSMAVWQIPKFSDKQPLYYIRNSADQKFGQVTMGTACLCSIVSGI